MAESSETSRERQSLNEGWRFYKYAAGEQPDGLIYDVRPEIGEREEARPADAEPTEAVAVQATGKVLKPWVLPSANEFLGDPLDRHKRPAGHPGSDFPFVQRDFDDSAWQGVTLPHDWAIEGPFQVGWGTAVGGGMGRLPSPGVAWYRRKLDVPESVEGKRVYLDMDGAMSYAIVWLNGRLVGGWPFGYASWRLDLTPHLRPGEENQLAIRLDNPPESSRWYPGGGIYRSVWLTTVEPVHVAHWGTFVTTPEVSVESAAIDLRVEIANRTEEPVMAVVDTRVFATEGGQRTGEPVGEFETARIEVAADSRGASQGSTTIRNPRRWGPPPTQRPHLYIAETTVRVDEKVVDTYRTPFGIREVLFDPDRGVLVNGERIPIRGANQHHDLGPLGAAFNRRAAERQLELLREAGCNAIRMAHNPPAPEMLDLTDRMGLLVVDETFDVWERKKTPLDFHLIFSEWGEADTRALVRRDRNHPSVIAWSIGNEVGEQYTGEEGAAVARRLHTIVKQEDPTRPTTTAMNFAKPSMPLPGEVDLISLNYQGEGIRDAPAYRGLSGITTPPLYDEFHQAFPDKAIVSSENAAAVSTRGAYLFPVFDGVSAPVKDGAGGDPKAATVSSYELYTTPFGSSADKVFRALAEHPFVAGGFVWSGWDYLGEPTPYYSSRSSYFGIIDLAGFKKDRFYLYQAHWRPDHPMVHVFPHWTWPERVGQTTPVHVATSGDSVELFLNGRSLGRKDKRDLEYRLRWDDVKYEPGKLRAIAYKHGKPWAETTVVTAGPPQRVTATADRMTIAADGVDLAFVSVTLTDSSGVAVPQADNEITFSLDGPGKLLATATGNPADMTSFRSNKRHAFNGKCLAIVSSIKGAPGSLRLVARCEGLDPASVVIDSQ